jgi:hypothetical protein
VKVPNHTLYGEKIYNLTETSGAVHEFIFHFNVFHADTANMVRTRGPFTGLMLRVMFRGEKPLFYHTHACIFCLIHRTRSTCSSNA